MTDKKKENDSFLNTVCKILDVSPATIIGGTRLEILNNNEAVLEGYKSVLEYCDNCIRISTSKASIKFSGRNLAIKTMSEGLISISGYITSIEFI